MNTKFHEASEEKVTALLSNLRKASCREWHTNGEWQKLGTWWEVILGIGDNEQKASRKLWDACPVRMDCKYLVDNMTNK